MQLRRDALVRMALAVDVKLLLLALFAGRSSYYKYNHYTNKQEDRSRVRSHRDGCESVYPYTGSKKHAFALSFNGGRSH